MTNLHKMDNLAQKMDNLADILTWHAYCLSLSVNARYAKATHTTLQIVKLNLGGLNYETCNVS